MKRIACFLSYAGTLYEMVENGNFIRLEKELRFLTESFIVDFYSKDSNAYLMQLSNRVNLGNVNFYGIPFSLQYSKNSPLIINRAISVIMLLQYYFLLVLKYKAKLRSADCFYIQHVSGGVAAVIYKILFEPYKKIVSRYNWNWGYFIKNSRNKLEYKLFCVFEKLVLRNSNIVLVGTDTLKIAVGQITNNKNKVVLIPNWIDCDIFKPLNLKKDFDIISVGRLCQQKNHFLLLEAVNLYKKENKNRSLNILIIGRGELKQDLFDYAMKNSINLIINERVLNDDMFRYFNRAVMFVMSSRYEGHPKAMLEAMACGLPVIGTDVVGIKDIIENKVNGLLCKEDSFALKEKIKLLLKNEDYRRKLSVNGINYVNSNCSAKYILNKIKEYLT